MLIRLLLNKLRRLFIYLSLYIRIYLVVIGVCVCVFRPARVNKHIDNHMPQDFNTPSTHWSIFCIHTHTHTHTHTTKRWKCRLFYRIRWLLSIVTSDGHKQFVVWCQGMTMFMIMNGTPPGFTPFVYFEMQLRNGAIDSQVHLWHTCLL